MRRVTRGASNQPSLSSAKKASALTTFAHRLQLYVFGQMIHIMRNVLTFAPSWRVGLD